MVNRAAPRCLGFTLVELLIVLAIVAVLLTLALPRQLQSIDAAKETALRENLRLVRDTIDKFHGDKGRYPDSLQELVAAGYIRALPVDPITERNSAWILIQPDSDKKGGLADIRSGAPGAGRDGKAYVEY
jgi:general secretion pathway protein G